MTRRALLALCGVLACKGDEPPARPAAPVAPPGDARAADATGADWAAACAPALRGAMKVPANRRVAAILDACRPCGDWTPLLAWDKPAGEGGPSRVAIDQAMQACDAYCDANAKQRFLGTLDAARGKGTRGPWRLLGEACKARVSAVPDARYVSAPHFALDRIARAAAARPELAPLLAAIELAMPPVTVTGAGFELARSPVTAPDTGPLALSVTATELRIASAPRARLGERGVSITSPGEAYPGALVRDDAQLEAAIAELGEGAVAIFAPRKLAAARLVAAIALAGPREVRLAVAANGGPPGWQVAGTVPVALVPGRTGAVTLELTGDPDRAIATAKQRRAALADAKRRGAAVVVRIAPDATVEGFAKLLGALVYFDVDRVAVRAR